MSKRKKTTDKRSTVDRLIDEFSKDDPDFHRKLREEALRCNIGQQIYDARTEAGLTQAALAKLVGTTTSAISRLEDADYEGHSMSMLRRVAEALGKEIRFELVDQARRTRSKLRS